MKDWRIDNEQSSVQHNKVEWNSNERYSMHLVAQIRMIDANAMLC